MRVLAFDVSGSTGWAFIDSEVGRPSLQYGIIKLPKPARDFAPHPWGYVDAANYMTYLLQEQVDARNPEVVVIEETNGCSRSRFTQKFLEYLHFSFLVRMPRTSWNVVYINTSEWRKVTDTHLTKEDKSRNARLSRHKRKARVSGEKLNKKTLGIAGRTTIKHVAVRRANELYGLTLKAKDDDIADALLLLHAYLNGAKPCMGSD